MSFTVVLYTIVSRSPENFLGWIDRCVVSSRSRCPGGFVLALLYLTKLVVLNPVQPLGLRGARSLSWTDGTGRGRSNGGIQLSSPKDLWDNGLASAEYGMIGAFLKPGCRALGVAATLTGSDLGDIRRRSKRELW
eukprot:777270-Amorphochlora_amoeboformis.AAC.1